MKKLSLYVFLVLMFCNIVLAQSSLPKKQSLLPKCQGTNFSKWTNCYGEVGPLPIDRDVYIGEWKDGKYHGQGTHTYPDGRKYAGEWKDDLPNGQGTWIHPDGRKYVGEWKNGLWHGKGTFTYPDRKVVKGIFKEGELVEQQQ